MLIIRRSNCINTASGIVFIVSDYPVCRLRRNVYLYSPYGPYCLYRASLPVQVCTLPLSEINCVKWNEVKCSAVERVGNESLWKRFIGVVSDEK